MADIKKTLTDVGRQIARWAKTGGSTAAEWWEEKSAIQARASEIRKLNRQRHEVVVGIGSKVYTLHRRGKVRNRDLLTDCERIDDIGDDIERLKAEIEEIRRRRQEAQLPPEQIEDDSPVVDEADVDTSVAAEEPAPEEEAPAQPEQPPETAEEPEQTPDQPQEPTESDESG